MARKRHLPVHDCDSRTRDAQAVAAKKRYFEGLEDWQDLFAEVDRKDPGTTEPHRAG